MSFSVCAWRCVSLVSVLGGCKTDEVWIIDDAWPKEKLGAGVLTWRSSLKEVVNSLCDLNTEDGPVDPAGEDEQAPTPSKSVPETTPKKPTPPPTSGRKLKEEPSMAFGALKDPGGLSHFSFM